MTNKKLHSSTTREDNPRYVRILYLKEVKKPRQLDDEDQPFADKKSLAYLSSLIQDEKKLTIKATTPNFKLSSAFTTDFPRVADSPIRTVTRPKSFYVRRQSSSKINNSRSKENSLSQIIGTTNFPVAQQVVKLRRRTGPQIIIRDSADKNMKEQLQKDFIGFCFNVKPSGKKYPFKCLMPSSKSKSERDELQERSVTLAREPNTQTSSYLRDQIRQKPINQTQEVERARLKRSIIYRKNFREMQDFAWGKLANNQFNLDI